jgi:hypothetical protein
MADSVKVAWRDVTSYSRDEKARRPSVFTIAHGSLSITVLDSHIYHRGRWVMHCRALQMETVLLPSATCLEEAQAAAIDVVAKCLRELSLDLEAFR